MANKNSQQVKYIVWFLVISILIASFYFLFSNMNKKEKRLALDNEFRSNEVVTVAVEGNIDNVNPLNINNYLDYLISTKVYETLFNLDSGTGKLMKSELVSDYKNDNDQVITIYLNKNAKFHNGNKITAKDVKKSLEYSIRYIYQKNSGQASIFANLTGYQAFAGAGAAEIQGIQTVDDNTLKFILTGKDPQFLKALSLPQMGIQFVKADKSLFTAGTGEYKIVDFLQNHVFCLGEAVKDTATRKRIEFQLCKNAEEALMELEMTNADVLIFKNNPFDYLKKLFPENIKYVKKIKIEDYLIMEVINGQLIGEEDILKIKDSLSSKGSFTLYKELSPSLNINKEKDIKERTKTGEAGQKIDITSNTDSNSDINVAGGTENSVNTLNTEKKVIRVGYLKNAGMEDTLKLLDEIIKAKGYKMENLSFETEEMLSASKANNGLDIVFSGRNVYSKNEKLPSENIYKTIIFQKEIWFLTKTEIKDLEGIFR